MIKQHKAIRETFALSLGGVTAVTGFSAMPAISHERLRKGQAGPAASKPRQLNWRVWMPRRFRATQMGFDRT